MFASFVFHEDHDHGVPTLVEHHVLENWKTELQPKFTVMESSIRDIFTGWWFGTFGLFFHILGIRWTTDFHIFQRGWNHQPVIFGHWAGAWKTIIHSAKNDNIYYIPKTRKTPIQSSKIDDLGLYTKYWLWPVSAQNSGTGQTFASKMAHISSHAVHGSWSIWEQDPRTKNWKLWIERETWFVWL